MAKIKNKKRDLSEKVNNKIKDNTKKKQLNPFEVHINKDKMPVLGRKLKNDRGLPGISRAKAIIKRKNTLLHEYQQQNKTNQFLDKRIGEKNMNENDKITARFTAVRMKQHKKSIFNLPDDDIQLTHKGQTLSEIEKFDDPRSSDDDDDNYDLNDKDKGRLDSKFVQDAHFGGGIFNKSTNDGARTHKDLIDQLITESKKRKAEKQQIKEATLELTEQLDSEWKDLLPLVNKQQRQNDEGHQQKEKIDDYDRIMRELKFEARGMATDRLKTEDELAKEEKEKLEELEKERLERMKGLIDDKQTEKTNHRSADDLDDDFVYESVEENFLTYNAEGEANVEIDAQLNGKEIGKDAENGEENAEEEEDDNQEEDKEDDGDDDEDNLSDLKAESSDEDTDNVETPNEIQANIKQDLLKRKQMMDKARDELPFTFDLPDSYEMLQKLFENRSGLHHGIILERMLKCNHPSLGKDNKEKLAMLFAYLLQYLNDCANEAINDELLQQCFDIFTNLTPHMYELAKLNPQNTHNTICEVIKEKQEEFRKKSKKTCPGVELLVFLKLISLLFTTSDFRHQVVTPCFVFIEQILNKCRVKTKRDISYGLFLCTIVLEYTSLSKRYMPAVINYLAGILHMAIPKFGVKLIKIQPPFRATSTDLVLIDDLSKTDLDLKLNSTDLLSNDIDNNFKCRTLYLTVNLIEEFDNNFTDLPSNIEIFKDITDYLKQININNYPQTVREDYTRILQQLEQRRVDRKLNFVRMAQQRPKALRMLEPKIEEVFDGKRFKVQSKEKAERDKLLHKLKKETKGALREIRRDKSFLGRVKIQQQIHSDRERRAKVKRIYSEASIQQSELNAMDRNNKKRK